MNILYEFEGGREGERECVCVYVWKESVCVWRESVCGERERERVERERIFTTSPSYYDSEISVLYLECPLTNLI